MPQMLTATYTLLNDDETEQGKPIHVAVPFSGDLGASLEFIAKILMQTDYVREAFELPPPA